MIAICRERRVCSHCGELNGRVTKHLKSFRILHAKYKKLAPRSNFRSHLTDTINENEETSYFLELYDNIVDYEEVHNAKQAVSFRKDVDGNVIEDLMPWDVRALFEDIEPADYVLIGLRFAHHRPQDLILTKLPVPPSIIRPGARMDDGKANNDDLTVQLSKILDTNMLIERAMEKGGHISAVMETFFLMNKFISEYFNSALPGYPVAAAQKGIAGRMQHCVAGTRQLGGMGKRSIRSFNDRLKGKYGRFRGKLVFSSFLRGCW